MAQSRTLVVDKRVAAPETVTKASVRGRVMGRVRGAGRG